MQPFQITDLPPKKLSGHSRRMPLSTNETVAMFLYRGPASAFGQVIGQIFGQWLPNSGYSLDDRPHFEVLPKGYRMDDPNAEEEIWIPIKPTERQAE